VEGTLNAGSVTKATIQILHLANTTLIPVIGEVGVNVLFKRSLHLTSKTFSWLAIAENHGDTGELLTRLSQCLAGRHTDATIECSSAVLIDFTELLATLIGDSLVETLLGSLIEPLALSSKQNKTPKQEQTPKQDTTL